MNIPYKLNPMGSNVKASSTYITLAFLESTGEQFIDTHCIPNVSTGLFLDAQAVINGDTIPFGCRNVDDVDDTRYYALRPPSDKSFGYGWGVWDTFKGYNGWNKIRLFTRLNWKNSRCVESALAGMRELADLAFVPLYSLYLFAANIRGAAQLHWGGRIWSAGISQGGDVESCFIPAIDLSGRPCMFDKIKNEMCYNVGNGEFVAGVGSLRQLLTILDFLPATGGLLTLSLPYEANSPEGSSALEQAQQKKGWTFIVRNYRAPSAALYTLKRGRDLIWCCRVRSNSGQYLAADGSRWSIESCVAVFGTLGNNPSLYGFEQFESVEQAAQIWELMPRGLADSMVQV